MKHVVFILTILAVLPIIAEPAGTAHGPYIKGAFKTGPDVTRFCITCHRKEAEDFIKTPHWKWKGPPRSIAGMKKSTQEYGKINILNNFCISVEGGSVVSNIASCSSCHPSYGFKDRSFDFTDISNIDCLVCHAKPETYKRGKSGEIIFMVDGFEDKLLKRAISTVAEPERENCGVCHFYGGGGDGVKHGDMGSFLANPGRESDVHMGKPLDMKCQTCHITVAHRISGASTFLPTNDGRIACEQCHDGLHRFSTDREQIVRHTARVSCQACHIPAFARTQPTKTSWDWSKVGADITAEEQYGRETFLKHKGTFTWDMNVTPVYAWYDGTISRYLKGDKIPEDVQTVSMSHPSGDISSASAKIYPFKVHRSRQPMDSTYRYLLVPHLYKGLWEHLDWQKALEEGAKGSGLPFSGSFQFIETTAYAAINHEVAPRDHALKCNDCHFGSTRLDWQDLGYPGDPAEK